MLVAVCLVFVSFVSRGSPYYLWFGTAPPIVPMVALLGLSRYLSLRIRLHLVCPRVIDFDDLIPDGYGYTAKLSIHIKIVFFLLPFEIILCGQPYILPSIGRIRILSPIVPTE